MLRGPQLQTNDTMEVSITIFREIWHWYTVLLIAAGLQCTTCITDTAIYGWFRYGTRNLHFGFVKERLHKRCVCDILLESQGQGKSLYLFNSFFNSCSQPSNSTVQHDSRVIHFFDCQLPVIVMCCIYIWNQLTITHYWELTAVFWSSRLSQLRGIKCIPLRLFNLLQRCIEFLAAGHTASLGHVCTLRILSLFILAPSLIGQSSHTVCMNLMQTVKIICCCSSSEK